MSFREYFLVEVRPYLTVLGCEDFGGWEDYLFDEIVFFMSISLIN